MDKIKHVFSELLDLALELFQTLIEQKEIFCVLSVQIGDDLLKVSLRSEAFSIF